MKKGKPSTTALAVAAALFALLLGRPASGDYWVAIGAFRTPAAAAELAAAASESLPFSFSTLAVAVGDQELHRVSAGPLATLADAKDVVARVRAAGYEDAWIRASAETVGALAPTTPAAVVPAVAAAPIETTALAAAAAVSDASGDASAADVAEQSADGLRYDDWNTELPPIEVLLRALPDVETAPDAEGVQGQRDEMENTEVNKVVPEDFELHKLRRSGAHSIPPAAPVGRSAPQSVGRPFVGQRLGDGQRFGDFDVRIKWFASARSLPADDVLRQATGDATSMGHNADLRSMWRKEWGRVKLLLAHSTTWLHEDARAASPGLTFDQTPTDDGRRLLDLSWPLGDRFHGERLHRLDRLALQYRNQRWGVTVGRQAVSWGGGLVFHPMDLFNPFAPTTVDQDYKAGDDLLLIERLFDDGSDLQLLAVGRRNADGQADFDASSIAAKYRAVVRGIEFELLASQHYRRQVYGVGLRVPAGGALVRSDLTWSADDGGTFSGLVNADYSIGVRGAIVRVFGEYFYNGFGVDQLPRDFSRLPQPLIERIGRGELFNLMRHYLALGTSFRWHFLLDQSLALIANLRDGSFALQAALVYDASEASRLQVGVTMPFGKRGDEFGGVTVGEGLTVGGGGQGFLRFVYFF